MAVRSSDWLDLMRREYLRRFVPGGGSAIKFVIGDDPDLADIRLRLGSSAIERGLHFVEVDAASTKIHMIQDVFFALSRSIEWEGLAQTWVEEVFRRYRYDWPKPGSSVPLREIAAANDIDEHLLRKEVQQWLTRDIMRDKQLAQDFGAAMTNLCMGRMELGDERATAPVVEWLRGELRTIGPVKQVPISVKITRHNGRAMLRSLCHWLRMCGGEGIAVTIDLTQLGKSGAAAGEGIRYSTAAVMDAFEVLRQLIDDTESFQGLFLAILVNPSFRDDDSKRGVTAYRALKERIWADVHARAHENPLTPMVQIDARDSPAPGYRGELLEMPYSEARVAIEALRAGVPNRAAIRQLGSSEQLLCNRFVAKLRESHKILKQGEAVKGELIAGGFGAGKSHLLGFLAEHALSENYIVSVVPVSKETPLFDPQKMFASAIRNAIVPDSNDDVMTAVLRNLKPASDAFDELEHWASDDRSGLSALFAAILYLVPKQTIAADDLTRIARFFGGSDLRIPKVKEWLRAAGASKLFNISATKAADLALQRLRFAPRLFAAAGYSGWCILIDEVELIGRYSTLQRGRSYAELCRWLNLDSAVDVPGIVSVAAITDDFDAAVLHGRLDQEKVPAYLQDKGLEQHSRLAKIGMELIEKGATHLSAPDNDRLNRSLDRVRYLYAESYGWPATAGSIGVRDKSRTMREYIKSWITVWDIDRIYGQADEVDTETLAPDYTENVDLEHATAPEAADDERA